MLFVVEKNIEGGICHAVHQYEKDKCMKHYDENKESSYINL